MRTDTLLVFLPNDHLIVWLGAAPEPPGRLMARIRAGEWPLPPAIADRFEIPPGLALYAHSSARVIVILPNQPLREKMPGAPVRLSAAQARVIALMSEGLTARQIARAVQRSPRWVRYQVAGVKRCCRERWEQAAEAGQRFRPRRRGSPGQAAG